MKIHCTVNKKGNVKPSEFQKLYKAEFYNRGYFAKIYAGFNAADVKEKFKKEYPSGEYYRSKRI